MDPERWRQVERLFRAAALLPAAEREALLDRECAADRELRRDVAELLALDDADQGSLAGIVDEAARRATLEVALVPPERVGPYRLVRELGTGGMGMVFLGLRDDDTFSKEVAIKVLRQGLRPDLVQRFRIERQILATLEHPHIARLLDGGTTERGEPYVVMEYVDGQPIDEDCQRRRLSTRERLELYCKVCNAVQYAHERGVVHRDLKPSNILISSSGEPKLLDFGIAKLLDPAALPVSPMETATAMRLMTPQYASPEQVRGEPVTIVTDVYALGIVLYELLTGSRPYRVSASDPRQIERAICELDPPRPSRAVTHARRRGLSGDVDTIVMTALQKEVSRRYGSAGEMAHDLRRHLDGLPVRARPATLGYRLAKAARRRPAVAALVATLALTVPALGILGARVWQHQRAARETEIQSLIEETRWLEERRRPAEAEQKADAILRHAPGHPVALRHRALARLQRSQGEVSAENRERLERGALDDAARVVATVPNQAWPFTLQSYVLEALGRGDDARAAAAAAGRHRSAVRSDDDLDFSAQLALSQSDYARAIELLSELIAQRPDRASAIASRAYAHEQLGDKESALVDYRVAIGIDPTQDLTLVDLARFSLDRQEYEAAGRYLKRSLKLRPEGPSAHEFRGRYLLQLGMRAVATGDIEVARRYLSVSERASRRSLALDPSLRWAGLNVAATLIERSRLEPQADRALEEAVAIYRAALDGWLASAQGLDDREQLFAALSNTCDALLQLGRLEEALDSCRRVTERFPDAANGFYNLAGAYALLGRPTEAFLALQEDFELGDDDWQYLERDPWFESLRGEEAFERLLQRMRERRGSASTPRP